MTHLTVHEWGRVPVSLREVAGGSESGFTRSQADALLGAARAHMLGGADGTDILCDHHRFLRARQMVGVIAAPGCTLEILPKIDPEAVEEAAGTVRARLVHMLDVALGVGLSTGESSAMAHRAESLLEVFIALFADRLLAEVRRGLPRHYRAQEDDLRALRGRLAVVRQFTVHAVRSDRLACRFDALDADIPLMQIMKGCVLVLTRHARAGATQRKLAELRFLLADVSEVPRAALPWKQVRIDRASRRWRALLELARLLLGARWQQTHAKARAPEGITLLFPMNDLFERYIAVQLRRALTDTGLEVVAQGGGEYCLEPWEGVGEYSHATRPDIIVREADGAVLCVIDTKWKQFVKGMSQADVYQMMAYARLYRCPRLILLYPAGHGDVDGQIDPHRLSQGTERLEAARVRLGDSDLGLQRVLRRLLIAPTSSSGRVPVVA